MSFNLTNNSIPKQIAVSKLKHELYYFLHKGQEHK